MYDLIWTCVDRVFADEKKLLHTFAQMLLTVIKPPASANQVDDQQKHGFTQWHKPLPTEKPTVKSALCNTTEKARKVNAPAT